MRRQRTVTLFFACALCVILSACGSIADKVSQTESTIEVGERFQAEKMFICEDGVTISLKEGETIDTGKTGEKSAVFIISSGKKQEEKSFSFTVVDTEAPVIYAENIYLYEGEEFVASEAICIDNSGENIDVKVDASAVDTSTAGRYTVTYSATDSSGNTSNKDITVNVLPLDTAEAVMDKIDQYLSQNGYTMFKYNKNSYRAVFITAPELRATRIDPNRYVIMYPEIYILKDLLGDFGVSGIIFRFEYSDRTDPQDDRYILYSNELTISSENTSIKIVFDGIPTMGKIDRYEYLTKFYYTLDTCDFQAFHTILDEGLNDFDVNAYDSVYELGVGSINEPYQFTYNVTDTDAAILKATLSIAEYFVTLLGTYS